MDSITEERIAPDATAIRDRVDGVDKAPLQFVPLRHKLAARPHLERVMTSHGYPEHAVRWHPQGGPFAYVRYGLIVALLNGFRDVYRSSLTPQIWTPFGSRGWRRFPHSTLVEQSARAEGVTFAGLSLRQFLQRLSDAGDPVFLYVNPTFWSTNSPDFDTSWMFDKDGDSQLFVVRVGASSDADQGAPDETKCISAEMSRRGSATFGAIHQVLFWGGVRWAGTGYNRLRARTWMVVRDNAARRDVFGKRGTYRMLSPDGRETTGLFALRETSWLDDAARCPEGARRPAPGSAGITGLVRDRHPERTAVN